MKFRPLLESLDGRIVPDSASGTPPADTSHAPEVMVEVVRPGTTEPVTVSLNTLIAEIAAAPVDDTQVGSVDGLLLELGLLQAANQALAQESANNQTAIQALSQQFDVLQNKIDDLEKKVAAETDPDKKKALIDDIKGLQGQQKALVDAIKVLADRQAEIAAAVQANNARIQEILNLLGLRVNKVSIAGHETQFVEV